MRGKLAPRPFTFVHTRFVNRAVKPPVSAGMKALITLLIVGTSSVALAQPLTVRDHRDTRFAPPPITQPAPRPRPYHPGRYQQDMRYRATPVVLAQNVQLAQRGRFEQRPLHIDVDRRIGAIRKLRIDRDTGMARVDRIVVRLTNGRTLTYRVDRYLSARSPSIEIDLQRQAIDHMWIYGSPMRGRASFDVTALRR